MFPPKKLADIDPLNTDPLVYSTFDADGVLTILPKGYSSLNNKVFGPIKLPVLPYVVSINSLSRAIKLLPEPSAMFVPPLPVSDKFSALPVKLSLI